jgi:transposase
MIALEATSNSWDFHDRLKPFFRNLHIANPHKLKVISSSSHKTDRHDAQIIAKMLAAKILPTVWVPPIHVRQLRQLSQDRDQLVQERKNMKNRLHSILVIARGWTFQRLQSTMVVRASLKPD